MVTHPAWRGGAQAHGLSADLWILPRVAWQRSSNASPVSSTTRARMENPGCGLVRMNWTVQKREQQAKERNPDQLDLEDRALARAKIETLSVNAPGSSLKTKLDSPVTLGPPDLGTAGGKRQALESDRARMGGAVARCAVIPRGAAGTADGAGRPAAIASTPVAAHSDRLRDYLEEFQVQVEVLPKSPEG